MGKAVTWPATEKCSIVSHLRCESPHSEDDQTNRHVKSRTRTTFRVRQGKRETMKNQPKTILPDTGWQDNPDRVPVTWFPAILPDQTTAHSRETRPPLDPRSLSPFPARVNTSDVGVGDRFGCRVILGLYCDRRRVQGFPCHHTWGCHTVVGCSDDSPECPCNQFQVTFWAVCKCDCGASRTIDLYVLVRGQRLSCGYCFKVRAVDA